MSDFNPLTYPLCPTATHEAMTCRLAANCTPRMAESCVYLTNMRSFCAFVRNKFGVTDTLKYCNVFVIDTTLAQEVMSEFKVMAEFILRLLQEWQCGQGD